jgi:hypothetical protein
MSASAGDITSDVELTDVIEINTLDHTVIQRAQDVAPVFADLPLWEFADNKTPMFSLEHCAIACIEYIEQLPRGIPIIFKSGEYDINQTDFEYLSNQCALAVIAESITEGTVLLRLLRIIYDKNWNLLFWDLNEHDPREVDELTLTTKQVVEILETHEANYLTMFENDVSHITSTLSGCHKVDDEYRHFEKCIRIPVAQVDIWDRHRIRSFFTRSAYGK